MKTLDSGFNMGDTVPETHRTAHIEKTAGPNRIVSIKRWNNDDLIQYCSIICASKQEVEDLLGTFGGREAFKEIIE